MPVQIPQQPGLVVTTQPRRTTRFIVPSVDVFPVNRPVGTRLTVQVTPEQAENVRVAKFSLALIALEDFGNVDDATYGLNDNSVLVYNTENAVWVVTPFDQLEIDGGTY